jgi:hypothetical protein
VTAIVAGFLLVGYLLGPGAIYRTVFGLLIISKRVQRSRTEEVVFSVAATLIPFALTWVLLCHTPVGRIPQITGEVSKYAAYAEITNALTSEPSHPAMGAVYVRALKEQLRFIAWLWTFCVLEAVAGAWVLSNYGDLAERYPRLARLCEKLLLIHVSEWQWLLTTDFLPKAERNKIVEVDVLTAGGLLYRGQVADWFTETDGKLQGIFLTNAARYNKDELKRDREAGIVKPVASYWRSIPGSNLHILASSISNYNVRYQESRESKDALFSKEMGESVRVVAISGAASDADAGLEEFGGVFSEVGDDEVGPGPADA